MIEEGYRGWEAQRLIEDGDRYSVFHCLDDVQGSKASEENSDS
jgi:hypothetical protein